jgi:truncated hemoglobin YjbI
MEGMSCPITGAYFESAEPGHKSVSEALAQLLADPDIKEEQRTLEAVRRKAAESIPKDEEAVKEPVRGPIVLLPLNVVNRTHKASKGTKALVRDVGLPLLRRFTTAFYKKCFVDPHIDQFLRRHSDPHGERFALWIMEKFGAGTPWTEERRTRPRDVVQVGHYLEQVAHDRSSAHYAAWHSPKRPAHKWGQHFKPDDARVWMRLHFWAARDVGLFEPRYAAFIDYYMRFIGHFVSVYSSKSPPFTRDSARWSADPRNIEQYKASGNKMTDVIDVPVERALSQLPADERVYTGSGHPNPTWPYEMRSPVRVER